MKKILLIGLLFISISGYTQIEFSPDSTMALLFPNITKEIKDFNSQDFDFQYRVWFHGGISIPPQYGLFVLTLKDNVWNWESYRVIHKKKKYMVIETNYKNDDCDSIVHNFINNDFLSLPTMEILKNKFFFIDPNGDTAHVEINDGQYYTFELIKKDKYRRYQYHCPVTNAKYYFQIPELVKVSNILKMIYRKLGYNYDPC